MRQVFLGFIFSVICFLVVQSNVCAQGEQADGMSASRYTSMTFDGAWCWFSDPRAIYYEDDHQRTYATWINSYGDIEIGYYDHSTGNISTQVVEDNFQADDHNNPSLLIDSDGQLMVFYSEHATEKPIYLRKSVYPEDITNWEDRRSLDLNDAEKYQDYSDTYTYTNPQYLAQEDKLFIFWRGSDFKPNYAVSEDGGKTWSDGRILILPDRKYRDRRPYLKVSSNGEDRIHFAFTDGHPRREPTNSIYYMYYQDGAFYKADGTKIKEIGDGPVSPGETSRVYNAAPSKERAWIWDVTGDQEGNPALVYAKFPDNKTHIYSYARWDGNSWQNHEMVDSGPWFPETPEGQDEPEPNYSGGVVLDHENPNTVYLSRQKQGVFEIEKWSTSTGGESWNHEMITRGSEQDNVRPFAVRNAEEGNPLQFLWMKNTRYIHYIDYLSSIQMSVAPQPVENPVDTASIKTLMTRVADWQLENPIEHNKLNWHYGAFYAGLWSLYETTGANRYKNKIRNVGQAHDWQLMPDIYHADRITVAQSYMDLYLESPNPEIIENMRWVADMHVYRTAPIDVTHEDNPYWGEWWTWCDALFMAPPFFARMYEATGNERYLKYMNKHWWKVSDYLYDEEDHLYYRDDRFFDAETKNGEKVFWSRGNGWVLGGLARVLEHMPDDFEDRDKFVTQFKEMSAKITSLQGEDGLWRSSLLDYEEFPIGESSGSAFFTYALAWGINQGILPVTEYRPVVVKGWKALTNNVTAAGKLGYVQQVGDSPKSITADQYEVYGAGAYLLAGSELYKLLKSEAK